MGTEVYIPNKEQTVLVIDDKEYELNKAYDIISRYYGCIKASSSKKALRLLGNGERPSLILLSVDIRDMNGFDVMKKLAEDQELCMIPVIFSADIDNSKGLEAKCFDAGATDYVTKPYDEDVLMSRIKRILQYLWLDKYFMLKNFSIQNRFAMEKRKVEQFTFQMLLSLSNIIDAKDDYTHGHSKRVAAYSTIIGKSYGLLPEELHSLHTAALLHDLGKIGISDTILRKEGKLSREEFEVIKRHPTIGFELLRNITTMPEIAEVAHYHHERWDGRGYPNKLEGESIPLFARIVSVSDSFDAMTSDRSYRKALSIEQAKSEILAGIGTQFDPFIGGIAVALIESGVLYPLDMGF